MRSRHSSVRSPSIVIVDDEPQLVKLLSIVLEKQGYEIVGLFYDGSENGYRAAETAIKLSKDYHAELVILRVVTAPTVLTPAGNRTGSSSILKEFYDYAEKDAEDYVGNLVSEAKQAGVSSVKGEVDKADSSPVPAISDKADSEKVDLIVIGTRGLDRAKRLILGSVSSGVVANSDIQVLVVR